MLTYLTSIWRPSWNFANIFGVGKLESWGVVCICIILRLAVLVQYRLATDGRTDGRPDTLRQNILACRRTVKIAFFDRSRSLRLRCLTVENLCPSATVVRVHDAALAEEYAVSSTALVVVEVGWSQLRSSWHQPGWLCGSLLMTRTAKFSVTRMWHGASHARCAVVEPTATMRVDNYAGSRIKRGSCWNCCSGWHGGYACVITITVGQHFNWYRASRGVSRR